MEKGLLEKTGKPLKHWVDIVRKENFEKHGQIISFLKKQHDFTYGFANFVAHKSRESDSGSMAPENLIENQYKGKENLKPVLDIILEKVKGFGKDVEIAPKKNSVSLRRKRQFALVQPSTKTRVDLGLKLDDSELTDRLENSGPFGAMCTNRVKLHSETDVDKELIDWLKTAYEQAG